MGSPRYYAPALSPRALAEKQARRFAIGTRVRYSRDFLRSTGQITGSQPLERGVVVNAPEVTGDLDDSFVAVKWDGFRPKDEQIVLVACFNLIGEKFREAE